MFKHSRKMTLVGAVALTAALALTSCSGSGPGGSVDDDAPLQIGIAQIVSHPSLDAARDGFKRALTEAGYVEGIDVVYDEQNAQGDLSTAASIAGNFAADEKDLILAIATPMAQAIAQAVQDIPILGTAVTPLEAGLVDSLEEPGGNFTGTTDFSPMEGQLSLIRDLAPEAKSIGVVYSSGEANSEEQVERARTTAAEMGLEVKEATISSSSEIQQAAESLDVDAFFVLLDNTVVSGLEVLIGIAEAKQIPVVTSDTSSVERGAIAARGVNYESLGFQTGLMAIEVLEGADTATMAVQSASMFEVVVNKAAAQRMGVQIPAELLELADTVLP